MSWFSKVAWKEGLFLQPQHLQQSDRYVEKLIQSRTEVITPYPWGVSEMVVDRDMAQQGRFGLRTVTGIMPDGDTFGGAMGEVVREGTRFMTDRDLEALAAYLMNEDEYHD